MDDSHPRRTSDENEVETASRESAAVAERLEHIIQACGGSNVATEGDTLWFALESSADLQVRLSTDPEARCYDRSVNFAISYGGQPSHAPISSQFRTIVERIKAIDASPLVGLATAFRPAAQAVVRRRANPQPDDRSPAPDPAPLHATPGARIGSESRLGRALNVLFLDFCLRFAADAVERLPPLHWGFWSTTSVASARMVEAEDPAEAFSLNLLSHMPESVTRILDVGCGLGCHERILSARGKHVTAISPVPHHCAVIENAKLPNVTVRCTRFEDLAPDEPFDLLLFSESVNHFELDPAFLQHCGRFLTETGFILMADDLSPERVRLIEAQKAFRILRTSDITQNVQPTESWFARELPTIAAYHRALMGTLELYDPSVAARVGSILGSVENSDLRALFSGGIDPPAAKGRYMIFLLQRTTAA